MADNIQTIWKDNNLTSKNIINKFIINNHFLSYEEENLNNIYLYDLFGFSNLDILNIYDNDLNKDSQSGDEKNLNLINKFKGNFC